MAGMTAQSGLLVVTPLSAAVKIQIFSDGVRIDFKIESKGIEMHADSVRIGFKSESSGIDLYADNIKTIIH